jgi:hypothetical protein
MMCQIHRLPPRGNTRNLGSLVESNDAANLDLAIEHAVTADMADGQPLPPLIEDGRAWHLMHRADGVSDVWGCLGALASPRKGRRLLFP